MRNEISCTKLQLPPESLIRGLPSPPPDPCSLYPLPSTEFVDSPPRTKFLGTPLRWRTTLCGSGGGKYHAFLVTRVCSVELSSRIFSNLELFFNVHM